jgi:ceramide glucosyltransferase
MVALFGEAAVTFSLILGIVYAALIIAHRRRIPRETSTLSHYPKVSVFLTLRNLDDGLEENLRSIFLIDYPNYDVFFAVDGMEDPCIATIERVRSRFKEIPSVVVPAGYSQTHNPKVVKLTYLERLSDAKLFWVLDSDIRVVPQTLRALVSEYLDHDAKMVFSPIRCRGAKTMGSSVEMSYVNYYMSGSIVTGWNLLRQRIVVGKSLLIERKTLDRVGGFARFSDVLAEDYWLGEVFTENGFSVRCNYTWVDNIKERSTVKNYFDRMGRWAKLRYNLKKPAYISEIFLNPLAVFVFAAPLIKSEVLPLLSIVLFMRIVLEYLVFFAIADFDRKRLGALLRVAPAALCKDLIMLVVYFMPFFSSTVTWRGGTKRIGKNTRINCSQETLLYDQA